MRKLKRDLGLSGNRLDCFGHFDLHDTFCMNRCHINIRCAIAKGQYDQMEIMEEFFDAVLETPRSQ